MKGIANAQLKAALADSQFSMPLAGTQEYKGLVERLEVALGRKLKAKERRFLAQLSHVQHADGFGVGPIKNMWRGDSSSTRKDQKKAGYEKPKGRGRGYKAREMRNHWIHTERPAPTK